MSNSMHGLSIALIIGKNGGLYVGKTDTHFRLCLWWVELVVYFFDLDVFHIKLANAAANQQEKK